MELKLSVTPRVTKLLQDLGCDDPDLLGQLGADLGDFYAESERCQRRIDQPRDLPLEDRDRLGDALVELRIGLEYIRDHLDKSIELLEAVADAAYGESADRSGQSG